MPARPGSSRHIWANRGPRQRPPPRRLGTEIKRRRESRGAWTGTASRGCVQEVVFVIESRSRKRRRRAARAARVGRACGDAVRVPIAKAQTENCGVVATRSGKIRFGSDRHRRAAVVFGQRRFRRRTDHITHQVGIGIEKVEFRTAHPLYSPPGIRTGRALHSHGRTDHRHPCAVVVVSTVGDCRRGSYG